MVSEADGEGNGEIVSFASHGCCFIVQNVQAFVEKLLKKYFSSARMSSFQRQLNLYGFRRIPDGPDKGGYWHENFLKDCPDLCRKIYRKTAPSMSSMAFHGGVPPVQSLHTLEPSEPSPVEQQTPWRENSPNLRDQHEESIARGMQQAPAAASGIAELLLNATRQQRTTFPPSYSLMANPLIGLSDSTTLPASAVGQTTNEQLLRALLMQTRSDVRSPTEYQLSETVRASLLLQQNQQQQLELLQAFMSQNRANQNERNTYTNNDQNRRNDNNKNNQGNVP